MTLFTLEGRTLRASKVIARSLQVITRTRLSSRPAATQEHPTHSCARETINCGLILFRKELLIRKVILMEDSGWGGGSKRFAKNYTNTLFLNIHHIYFSFSKLFDQ